MYNFKKIAALGLAFTMVLGSSLTAFASESTEQDVTAKVDTAKEIIGTGAEEYVDKNIMKVTMPTDAMIAKFFDYKLDPQGLVAQAKSYDGTAVTGTATGIVFLNDNKGKKTISNTSDAFTITNKSSIPVDLGVKVKLEAASGGIGVDTVSTTSDFSGDGDSGKTIYLGLRATNDVEHALNGTEKSYDAILLSGESQYASTWDTTDNKYVWAPITNAKFKDFTFNLTGTINKTLPNSTWATISGDVGGTGRTPTLKNPPKVSIKVTLLPVADALPITAKWTTNSDKADVLQIAKASAATGTGGFVAADLEKLYINGREIAAANYNLDAETGYITVLLEKIYPGYKTTPAWGSDAITTKDKTEVKSLIKSVKTTKSGSITYYGEL